MKGIKIGVIVNKQRGKSGANSDTDRGSDREKKRDIELRAADPVAHQKFVDNLFSVIK